MFSDLQIVPTRLTCAKAWCKKHFHVSKRDAGIPWAPKREEADIADGHEVFSLVDKDGSGNITREEYVDYLQYRQPSLHVNTTSMTDWLAYFEK